MVEKTDETDFSELTAGLPCLRKWFVIDYTASGDQQNKRQLIRAASHQDIVTEVMKACTFLFINMCGKHMFDFRVTQSKNISCNQTLGQNQQPYCEQSSYPTSIYLFSAEYGRTYK